MASVDLPVTDSRTDKSKISIMIYNIFFGGVRVWECLVYDSMAVVSVLFIVTVKTNVPAVHTVKVVHSVTVMVVRTVTVCTVIQVHVIDKALHIIILILQLSVCE